MDGRVVSFLPVEHWTGEVREADPRAASAITTLNSLFGTRTGMLSRSGREALDAWLAARKLRREDEVWITTTFDYPNVSSCVTCTIFNHCKPSRVLTPATRAILVIHEFGVPHPDLPELATLARSKDMPLIEDCAHTIDSRADGYAVGQLGDWVLVSFPKIFPVRAGGALLGRSAQDLPMDAGADVGDLEAVVAREMAKLHEYSARRRAVFARLEETARSYDYAPLFTPSPSITPWFFPVRTPRWRELIDAMHAARVDAASWHGSDIVVLPCHQFLGDADIDHIGRVLRSFSGARQ